MYKIDQENWTWNSKEIKDHQNEMLLIIKNHYN